jgi:hypothetical protein
MAAVDKITFDSYTLKARTAPAFLVAVPIGALVVLFYPEGLPGWAALWGLISWCGGGVLISQLGRDQGKKKESDLFKRWGGKPTTKMLRYRYAVNKALHGRRLRKLQELLPDLKIPTEQQENLDPANADDVYDSCAVFLREKTRNKDVFPLVFEENCNYGFRRNLWGMRPLGLTLAAVGACVVATVVAFIVIHGGQVSPRLALTVFANWILLFLWAFIFTSKWVRVAADAYAERLISSCDNL